MRPTTKRQKLKFVGLPLILGLFYGSRRDTGCDTPIAPISSIIPAAAEYHLINVVSSSIVSGIIV